MVHVQGRSSAPEWTGKGRRHRASRLEKTGFRSRPLSSMDKSDVARRGSRHRDRKGQRKRRSAVSLCREGRTPAYRSNVPCLRGTRRAVTHEPPDGRAGWLHSIETSRGHIADGRVALRSPPMIVWPVQAGSEFGLMTSLGSFSAR